MVTHTGAEIGNTRWRLVAMPAGSANCDHCGRSLRHLCQVVDPDGHEMTVGRGCVKKLTGWTLAAAEAARLLRVAERRARHAANWAQFSSDHPEQAALIDADITAYERQANTSAGICAAHELKNWIGDSYADRPAWTADRVADYNRRRLTFPWTR